MAARHTLRERCFSPRTRRGEKRSDFISCLRARNSARLSPIGERFRTASLCGTFLVFLSVVEFVGQDVLCRARCVTVAALDGHVDRLLAALKLNVADAVLVELVRDVELLVEVIDRDRAVLALFDLGLVEVLKEFFLRQCPLRAIRLESDASAAPLALVSFAVGIVDGIVTVFSPSALHPSSHR